VTLSHRIARTISTAHHIEPFKAAAIVDLVCEEMAKAVAGGDEVIFPGIGVLRSQTAPERRDHHPSTDAAMTIPASTRVMFEPAS
jgi:nucleoid DNA-binding protein